MVSLPERVALKEVVSLWFDGEGAVVEIGSLAGSSAIAILQGLRQARYPQKLHVYDAFLYPTNDLEPTYRAVLGCEGNSFRSVFDRCTRMWAHDIIVNEGDASKAKWTGGDIGLLHIDCSISQAFHEAIALEFYPHMRVGGVIVHQDYGYERATFIPKLMEKAAPWFKSAMAVDTTKYFKCTKKVSRVELELAISGAQRIAA